MNFEIRVVPTRPVASVCTPFRLYIEFIYNRVVSVLRRVSAFKTAGPVQLQITIVLVDVVLVLLLWKTSNNLPTNKNC